MSLLDNLFNSDPEEAEKRREERDKRIQERREMQEQRREERQKQREAMQKQREEQRRQREEQRRGKAIAKPDASGDDKAEEVQEKSVDAENEEAKKEDNIEEEIKYINTRRKRN